MLLSMKAHGGQPATGVVWRGDAGLATCGLDGNIVLYRYDPDAEVEHDEHARKLAEAKDDKARKELSAPPPIISRVHTFASAHTTGVAAISTNNSGSVMASTGINGDIAIWDLESYEKRSAIPGGPGSAWKVRFSPATNNFFTGGFGGILNVYNSDTAEVTATIPTELEFINTIDVSADGSKAALGGPDGTVVVVDVASNTVTHRINAHLLSVRSVSLSHDGKMLYTGSEDRCINVFDVSGASDSSSLVASLHGHLHWVTGVSRCPDKYVIASCSMDKTVRVWDVRKREALHTFEGYADKLWDVAWNPAGSKIAAVSDGGILGLHTVSSVM